MPTLKHMWSNASCSNRCLCGKNKNTDRGLKFYLPSKDLRCDWKVGDTWIEIILNKNSQCKWRRVALYGHLPYPIFLVTVIMSWNKTRTELFWVRGFDRCLSVTGVEDSPSRPALLTTVATQHSGRLQQAKYYYVTLTRLSVPCVVLQRLAASIASWVLKCFVNPPDQTHELSKDSQVRKFRTLYDMHTWSKCRPIY